MKSQGMNKVPSPLHAQALPQNITEYLLVSLLWGWGTAQ